MEEFEVLSHLEIFAYVQKSEKKKKAGRGQLPFPREYLFTMQSKEKKQKAKAFLSLLPTFLPSPTLPREERQGRRASQLYKLPVS